MVCLHVQASGLTSHTLFHLETKDMASKFHLGDKNNTQISSWVGSEKVVIAEKFSFRMRKRKNRRKIPCCEKEVSHPGDGLLLDMTGDLKR